jgi:hypothetical protein
MIRRIGRTITAGGLAFVLGTFVTFAQFSGSKRGQKGLLFNPATQQPKVIAVWKNIEPLLRVIENHPHHRGYAFLRTCLRLCVRLGCVRAADWRSPPRLAARNDHVALDFILRVHGHAGQQRWWRTSSEDMAHHPGKQLTTTTGVRI